MEKLPVYCCVILTCSFNVGIDTPNSKHLANLETELLCEIAKKVCGQRNWNQTKVPEHVISIGPKQSLYTENNLRHSTHIDCCYEVKLTAEAKFVNCL